MSTNTNLRSSLGQFVGREHALAAIASHADRGDRLVTILGPPGMGKTRLALRYAELHGARYLRVAGAGAAGGVWFCDLTAARTHRDLCAAVGRVFGLRLRDDDADAAANANVNAVDDIANALAERGPVLLILDNVEPIAKLAAATIEQWCAVAPETFVVVTSRERLGLAGEAVLDLLPLGLDPGGEALKLYEERSRRVGGWNDDVEAIAAATALVRALDGIPLAIELAAARSRVLGADKLLAQLAKSTKSTKSAKSPLRALRAAIDGSWEMLSAIEKSALAQCSIFAGDFSIEAAEAVINLSPGEKEGDDEDVVDVLGALVDKSLVNVSPTTKRFSLYASIREYAAERVTPEDADALASRHRRFFIDSTRDAAEAFARTGDPAARAKLLLEKENLLEVARSAKTKDVDLARVVLHLEPIIAAESSFEDLLAMLDGAIAASSSAETREAAGLRGRLLIARGNAHGIRAHNVASLSDLEAAREIGRAIGDAVLEAEALVMASVRYRHQGRFEDARNAGEEALTLLEGRRSEPRIEGAARAVLGLLFCELGEVDLSRRENLRARALFHAAGDRWSEALALANLAQLDQAAGDFEKSAHAYDAALERFREHGDRRYESRYLGYRAGLEFERGDVAAARATYATSLEMLSALRIRHTEALFRGCLAALEASEGAREAAMTELDHAADLLGSIPAGAPPSFLAAVAVHHGHLDLLLSREPREAAARQRLRDASVAAESSEDVRFAMRLLTRALSLSPAKAKDKAEDTSQPTPTPTLVIAPNASRFVIDGGAVVDLGRREALRLLLLALVERHANASANGTPLSWEALLAAGWPGERVLAAAGSTRVRVAISTLRRLGLARVLLTRRDGYLLDPRALVSVESPK